MRLDHKDPLKKRNCNKSKIPDHDESCLDVLILMVKMQAVTGLGLPRRAVLAQEAMYDSGQQKHNRYPKY